MFLSVNGSSWSQWQSDLLTVHRVKTYSSYWVCIAVVACSGCCHQMTNTGQDISSPQLTPFHFNPKHINYYLTYLDCSFFLFFTSFLWLSFLLQCVVFVIHIFIICLCCFFLLFRDFLGMRKVQLTFTIEEWTSIKIANHHVHIHYLHKTTNLKAA